MFLLIFLVIVGRRGEVYINSLVLFGQLWSGVNWKGSSGLAPNSMRFSECQYSGWKEKVFGGSRGQNLRTDVKEKLLSWKWECYNDYVKAMGNSGNASFKSSATNCFVLMFEVLTRLLNNELHPSFTNVSVLTPEPSGELQGVLIPWTTPSSVPGIAQIWY